MRPLDYQRLFAVHWRAIVAGLVVGAAIGAIVAQVLPPRYEAQAALRFRSLGAYAGLIGVSPRNGDDPKAFAAAGARIVRTDEVRVAAASRLREPGATAELRENVAARVDTATQLVAITARDARPSRAAQLANAVAAGTIEVVAAKARRRFARAAKLVEEQLERLPEREATFNRRAVLSAQLTRLRGLVSLGAPAELVQRAVPAGSPASPQPVFSTALGGAFGLMAGLLWAFGRQRLRARRYVPAPSSLTDHIVATIRSDELGAGEPAPAALREAATRIRRALHPSSIVAVASAWPQEGRTSVALSLAASYAAAEARTVLVEADAHHPAVAERVGVRSAPGLLEHLAHESPLEEAIAAVDDDAPFAVMPVGRTGPRATRLLASGAVGAVLAELRERYDVIVLDTAAANVVAEATDVLAHADAWVVCTRDDRGAGADDLVATLGRLRRRRLAVVQIVTDPALAHPAL